MITRKLTAAAAIASTLALVVGCSSPGTRSSEAVGAPVYSGSDAVQYGHVRNITTVDASQQTSGAGAVIGGVIGAAIGNQVGHGTGRAVATGAGAIGGAIIGNKIEQNRSDVKQYYQVDVQLDNGSMQSFKYADLNSVRVGDRVRVQDGQLYRW
jgi:outer membrane lipoprotein SlyB